MEDEIGDNPGSMIAKQTDIAKNGQSTAYNQLQYGRPTSKKLGCAMTVDVERRQSKGASDHFSYYSIS